MDDSATLAAVQLAKDFTKDIADCEPAFDTIKQLLIQKYGPPTTEERPTGEHWRSLRCAWYGSDARISLNYSSTPMIHSCFVNLTYAKPGDTDKL